MMMKRTTAHDARVQIQIQYIEMPGLRLLPSQLVRLTGAPEDVCAEALSTLLWSGFLLQTQDGHFVRGGYRATA